MNIPNLKAPIVKDNQIQGYFLEDLEKELSPTLYKVLLANLVGQTMTEIGGRQVIYKHDLERFLAGGSIAD